MAAHRGNLLFSVATSAFGMTRWDVYRAAEGVSVLGSDASGVRAVLNVATDDLGNAALACAVAGDLGADCTTVRETLEDDLGGTAMSGDTANAVSPLDFRETYCKNAVLTEIHVPILGQTHLTPPWGQRSSPSPPWPCARP